MKWSYLLLVMCLFGAGLISCDQKPPTPTKPRQVGEPTTGQKTGEPTTEPQIVEQPGNEGTASPGTQTNQGMIPVHISITGAGQGEITPDKVVVKGASQQREYLPAEFAALKTEGLAAGNYEVTIYKQGYEVVSLAWEVTSQNNTLAIRLTPKPREIIFERTLEWDSLCVDDALWAGTKGELPPGRHTIVVKKQGYKTYQTEIEIPVGEGPYQPEVFHLEPQGRAFVITARDSETHHLLDARLTLAKGSETFPVLSGDSVPPGAYTLTVQCKWYRDLEKKVAIAPDPAEYSEDVYLEPITEIFRLSVESDGQPIEVDAILLNERPVKIGDTVRAGEYVLKVMKTGYYPVEKKITLEQNFADTITLQRLPRTIILVFRDAKSGHALTPEVWLSDEKSQRVKYQANISLSPGSYTLQATLEGYRAVEAKFLLPPGEGAYSKDFAMEFLSKGCEVRLEIKPTPDFAVLVDPATLKPTVATLDGKAIQAGTNFSCGEHLLILEVPAYKRVEKAITIPEGEAHYTIVEYLEPLPTKLHLNIAIEDSCEKIQPPYQVRVDGQEVEVSKDFIPTANIAPGHRMVQVSKEGYVSLHEDVYIMPGMPFFLTRFMVAKDRKIQLTFIDAKTNEPVVPDVVRFTDKKKLTMTEVDFRNIFEQKPGLYEVEAVAKGYKTLSQELGIEPAEDMFTLTLSLEKE